MSDHVYRVIEIVGSSTHSSDDAIRAAVARAGQAPDVMDWFEVIETRGHIEAGQVKHFQLTLKIGFRVVDKANPGS